MKREGKILLSDNLCADGHWESIRTALEQMQKSGIESLKIDFSALQEINFDVLTGLLVIRNRFLQNNTEVVLINIPERINRIMQIFQVPGAEKHDNQYL